MPALKTFILIVWIVFGVYWLVSAIRAKEGRRTTGVQPIGLVFLLSFAVRRAFKPGSLAVHSPIAHAVGVVLILSGLGLAVWARVHIGRNWGMPMTQKDDPELVTSGPYRRVRHPIYSGSLLAVLGTALATNLYWLFAWVAIAAYFVHSARVEERLMSASFPNAYASYRAKSKMLIPFVL
ncbi:MAG: methyltransferase family protein [Solirubrobacteraceae bacterium]